MLGGCGPLRNELLHGLPQGEEVQIAHAMSRIEVMARQVLQTPNVEVECAYFFESASASLQWHEPGGKTLEVGFLDNRDCLGLPLILGAGRAPSRCIALTPGEALCISAPRLQRLIADAPTFRRRMLAYVHVSLAHSAQLSHCSKFHSVEERVARCLLTSCDQSGEIVRLTEEGLGAALAVGRAQVARTLVLLEVRGLARVEHGCIRILDRAALERNTCCCYGRMKRQRGKLPSIRSARTRAVILEDTL
jgi:CRP-like cAMP-binding protein